MAQIYEQLRTSLMDVPVYRTSLDHFYFKEKRLGLLKEDWWWQMAAKFFSVTLVEAKFNYLMSLFNIDTICCNEFFNAFGESKHADAEWLYGLFPGGINLEKRLTAKETLMAQTVDGGKSIFYASIFCENENESLSLLKQSMSMGYVRAYDMLSRHEDLPRETLEKGVYMNSGGCCHKLANYYNFDYWKEKGARLGDSDCICSYSYQTKDTYLGWILRYPDTVYTGDWMKWFRNAGPEILGSLSEYFLIGELSVRSEKTIMMDVDEPMLTRNMEDVFSYHKYVLGAVRDECICWVLVAEKLKVNKDVRKMIAKMVWGTRFEGRDKFEGRKYCSTESFFDRSSNGYY